MSKIGASRWMIHVNPLIIDLIIMINRKPRYFFTRIDTLHNNTCTYDNIFTLTFTYSRTTKRLLFGWLHVAINLPKNMSWMALVGFPCGKSPSSGMPSLLRVKVLDAAQDLTLNILPVGCGSNL